jgi:multisubunit Na+/H+ antiporter MnhF subunit
VLERDPRPTVKRFMLWTDVGFLGYWVLTITGFLSVGTDPLLQAWNWSFLGLDLVAIGTGLLSVRLVTRSPSTSDRLMVVSLALTAAAGLMALNFYVVRADYDLAWWLPNLWLLLFPTTALVALGVPRRPARS